MQYEGCTDCGPIFLQAVGLTGNHNYCAAFVAYSLSRVHASHPPVRSGLVSAYIVGGTIDGRHVVRGTYQVQKGDIIIWTQQYSHAGFSIEDWQGPTGRTIEGNTSDPARSGLYGVYVKHRDFSPGSYFRPRYITNVTY